MDNRDRERTMLTLLVSPEERALLGQLTNLDGGGGMSAYMRRLIRREARRLGLVASNIVATEEPAEVTA